MTKEELSKRIDLLIEQQVAFAAYRVQGEDIIHFICQDERESLSSFTDITDLNGRKGFVIAPFHATEHRPVVLINGRHETWDVNELTASDQWVRGEETGQEIPSEYADCFDRFMQELNSGKVQKLVLSRQLMIRSEDIFPIADAFLRACDKYIRSYVYMFYTPQTGLWLGGTPEILLEGECNRWHTVALAGTQVYREGVTPVWDNKNIEEQQFVVEYLRSQLRSIGIEAKEEGPYAVRAGGLTHLKSDFTFSLPDGDKLGDLLQLLHPTPAVCGLPKGEAYSFILDNEGYDRSYYSGFVGEIDPVRKTLLYVNLRCMQINPNGRLLLYAGGGLLPSSVLEDEWQETEDKLATMKTIAFAPSV